MFSISDDKGLERFDIAKLTERTDQVMYNLNNSKFLFRLFRLKNLRYYTVISEAGRPDLLSESLYGAGNYEYWWIIMTLNGLRYPSDLKINQSIKYPTLDQIENIYFELGVKPESQNRSSSKSSISKLEIL